MKRIILALAIFSLVLPATRPAEAAEVSVDFFYNNLDTGGSWLEVGDYGYCWQPSVAVSNSDWRPYTDGYWAYTDVGWTWISYEDFGWATYHYGRWARVRGHGWVWVPGREWGPAWVSWRTGGDHVGWAPLPPRSGYSSGGEVIYEGRAINGYVDIDFDIGPAYYNFVDIRYIGEPVLRQRILPVEQNVTYVTNTVNVTNITYNNSTVYNYGPDYDRMSAYSTRPIQRLSLKRESNADLSAAVKANTLTKVEGNTLMVAAPQELAKAEKSVAPKQVKTKIEKADVERGWSNISDEKEKEQLQAKMKKEDRKSIPPPKIEPQNPEALKAEGSPGAAPANETKASPDATAAPAASVAPEKEKGRGKDRGKPAPAATANPETEKAPDADADKAKADEQAKEKGRGKRSDKAAADRLKDAEKVKELEKVKENAPPTPATNPAEPQEDNAAGKIDRKGRDKKNKGDKSAGAPQAIPAPADDVKEAPAPAAARGGKKKESRLPDMQTSERPLRDTAPVKQAPPPQMEPPQPSAEDGNNRARGKEKAGRMKVPQPSEQAPQVAPEVREQAPPRKERQPLPPRMAPPQQAAPPQNAPANPQRGGGRPGKEKGNKKEKGQDEQPNPEG